MSVKQRMSKAVTHSVAWIVSCLILFGSAQGAVIFEQGPDYHVIGYEAGLLADGDYVGMVILRVETLMVSGQLKVNTTIEEVLIDEGWSYEIVKPGGINSSIEIDLFNGTCSGRFKALYKPGKTKIDSGVIRCR